MVNKADLVRTYKMAAADPSPSKVVLVSGTYWNEDGRPFVPPSVAEAERDLIAAPSRHHDYLLWTGDEGFNQKAAEFLLGQDSPSLAAGRAFAVQTPGGAGALFLGASYLRRHAGFDRVLISSPGYLTHHSIFETLGFDLRFYRYLDREKKRLDIEGIVQDLRAAPPSVVVLQASSHNPTGIDPSPDEWRRIADAVKDAGHAPFLDCAYLGFVSGDADADAASVRSFVAEDAGFPVVWTALSFSKNFGLYGERIGALVVVASDAGFKNRAMPGLVTEIYSTWNSPPKHPAEIVRLILSEEERREKWRQELKNAASRLSALRSELHSLLVARDPLRDWSLLTRAKGMFAFFDLTTKQAEAMQAFGVYIWPNGRVCLGALRGEDVERLVEALISVVGFVE